MDPYNQNSRLLESEVARVTGRGCPHCGSREEAEARATTLWCFDCSSFICFIRKLEMWACPECEGGPGGVGGADCVCGAPPDDLPRVVLDKGRKL